MSEPPVRITRDVDLYGGYTGLMSVTADPDWWRRVLVHLPDDFPDAKEIALHRVAMVIAGGEDDPRA